MNNYQVIVPVPDVNLYTRFAPTVLGVVGASVPVIDARLPKVAAYDSITTPDPPTAPGWLLPG
jgi:hypothetical protein